MPRAKPQLVDIEAAGFALDDKLRAWLDEKFPTVDPDGTFELFQDKALAKGWVYANWPAAFRNYMRRARDWGGVAYKPGLHDPAFAALIQQARAIGFRMPTKLDSPGTYRTALQEFDKQQAASKLSLFTGVIKRVPK